MCRGNHACRDDKFFHRGDETRQAFRTGENTRKFTRDYGKSDGIILTRVTSWRPRLIASREFCLSSRDGTLLLRERFIMEGYERLLKVAINERR